MNCIDALDAIPRVQISELRHRRESENDELDQKPDECGRRRTVADLFTRRRDRVARSFV
jgi:hypothetical protein